MSGGSWTGVYPEDKVVWGRGSGRTEGGLDTRRRRDSGHPTDGVPASVLQIFDHFLCPSHLLYFVLTETQPLRLIAHVSSSTTTRSKVHINTVKIIILLTLLFHPESVTGQSYLLVGICEGGEGDN